MNSTTDTIRHPDVSEISELTEGLLSPTRSAELRRHLEGCELCEDVRSSLEEIRALLGTLPGPQRMPGEVAGRIDAALAAEALLNATSPEQIKQVSVGGVSRETSSSLPPSPPASETAPAPSRPRTPRTGPTGRGGAATGPGRSRPRRRMALWGSALLGASALTAAVLFVPSLFDEGRPTASRQAEQSAVAPSTAESDALAPADTYTPQNLPSHVQQLLGSDSLSMDGLKPPSAQGQPERMSQAGEVLPTCVQKATGSTEQPLAFERGTYQGSAVYLVLLPQEGETARVRALLVDAGCQNSAPQDPGKVLFSRLLPRS
ncbi:zf-HC2 domain-containing protein [Streptomyces sp. NPDC006879]|uniref:zf-HC2 domain-containing protein n=1 Tax=Streptomyces sp. NPDC006879 TaxID=3364767 RepID=UPI0036C17A7D